MRLQQRIEAGKASINGIGILPPEQTIEHGRRLIGFRARVAAEAMRRVLGAAGRQQAPKPRAAGWALPDSNQRPPACKAGALDQLS